MGTLGIRRQIRPEVPDVFCLENAWVSVRSNHEDLNLICEFTKVAIVEKRPLHIDSKFLAMEMKYNTNNSSGGPSKIKDKPGYPVAYRECANEEAFIYCKLLLRAEHVGFDRYTLPQNEKQRWRLFQMWPRTWNRNGTGRTVPSFAAGPLAPTIIGYLSDASKFV